MASIGLLLGGDNADGNFPFLQRKDLRPEHGGVRDPEQLEAIMRSGSESAPR